MARPNKSQTPDGEFIIQVPGYGQIDMSDRLDVNFHPMGTPDEANLVGALLDPNYVENNFSNNELPALIVEYLDMHPRHHSFEFFNFIKQMIGELSHRQITDYHRTIRKYNGQVDDLLKTAQTNELRSRLVALKIDDPSPYGR